MSAARQTMPDAADVSARLAARMDTLAAQLLPAGRRKGNYWSVGGVDNSPGKSLFVHVAGGKAGKWQDAATGEFGDALDLVAACQCRGDLKAAYAWGLDWLGGTAVMAAAPVQPRESAARAASDEDEKLRRAALRIWLEGRPSLAGTPAADYLRGRGIDLAALGRQPRALRFHPACWNRERNGPLPALVAAVSGPDGAHIATHRTWIAPDGQGGWCKAALEDGKKSLGKIMGGCIRIARGASGKPLADAPPDEWVVIGEGIETCLSIAVAVPELRVLCAVSMANLATVVLPPQVRRLILAADNDSKPKAQAAFQRVVARLLDAGLDVRVARADIGKDFNDTLRAWG